MAHSIVLLHLGPELPDHLADAIAQIVRFNTCPVYLIAERTALARTSLPKTVAAVPTDELGISDVHAAFRAISPLDHSFRGGFWTYTTERFFYLSTFARKLGLENVIHIENDVLLYADVGALMPAFTAHYTGLASTFDHDERCIPGILYARTPQALEMLTMFIVNVMHQHRIPRMNDMFLLGLARRALGKAWLDALPIVPDFHRKPFANSLGHTSTEPDLFNRNFTAFGGVFDAAAIGQYLGGIDPLNGGTPGPGFINETSIFDPSSYSYEWIDDENGRRIPYLVQNEQRCPIISLHIHSKDLARFSS